MQVFGTMAVCGSENETLMKNLYGVVNSEDSKQNSDGNPIKKDQLSSPFIRNREELVKSSKRNNDDCTCCNMSDRMSNDISCSTPERNIDDINQSSDSLSSSASLSDSDLTSTDSEDSLALSESESITDVTPLNSPYCDSPLPHNRQIDFKSEDKIPSNISNDINCDVPSDSSKPEANVLLKAIEKLELEAKKSSEFGFRETLMHTRVASFSPEEAKRIEQENQCLLKRVISQHNRVRSIYSASNQPCSKSLASRHQALMKSDGDISETPKKSLIVKIPKDGDKFHVRRRQKCLSHPSSFMYSCNHHVDKNLLMDGLVKESCGKKKNSPRVKKISSLSIKSTCEEGSSTQLN